MELRRVLLVSTENCDEVEQTLHHLGCEVIKAHDGAAAVDRAKHAALDTAILVSAGRAMDRAETALNLYDIKPSIEIIMIASHRSAGRSPPPSERLGDSIPNTKVLTLRELGEYLATSNWHRGIER